MTEPEHGWNLDLPDANATPIELELRRLAAFVEAYRSMSSDPERRRALNYLRDRFPGPTVMRSRGEVAEPPAPECDVCPGSQIVTERIASLRAQIADMAKQRDAERKRNAVQAATLGAIRQLVADALSNPTPGEEGAPVHVAVAHLQELLDG